MKSFACTDCARASRLTLSKHLKHLTEAKLVKRKIAGKQNVNYRFYNEYWNEFDDYVEREKDIIEVLDENKDTFTTQSTISQINSIYFIVILRTLMQLKHELLAMRARTPIELIPLSNKILIFDIYRWREYDLIARFTKSFMMFK